MLRITGKFGLEVQNEAGKRLRKFCHAGWGTKISQAVWHGQKNQNPVRWQTQKNEY